MSIWPKEKTIGEIREIGEIWGVIRKYSVLPDSPEKATNMMITLVNQANYLLDKLIPALKERHKVHGGLTEELYRERKKYRGY